MPSYVLHFALTTVPVLTYLLTGVRRCNHNEER